MYNKKLAALAVGLIGAIAASQSHAAPVDLEIVLAMDVSGSIINSDFNLQQQGYKNAFLDPGVQASIVSKPNGVAVSLVQWSTNPATAIGWTLLKTAADATAFANSIGTMARLSSGSTGTARAVAFSDNFFDNNGYEGTRQVIDVSSDGMDNVAAGCSDNVSPCAALQSARDAFLNEVLPVGNTRAINALWIADPGNYTSATLLAYGTTNLVGGTNAFQSAVVGSKDFEAAIAAKITREFNDAPEPGSLALAGLALTGLFGMRRRAKQD
jgi:hypothetical protein